MKSETVVGIGLGILGLGFLAALLKNRQPLPTQPPQTTVVGVPTPVYPETPYTYPLFPEEPMPVETPEESGAGGYTPIVMSSGDCFMKCLESGYVNGNCMWPSEAPDAATKVIDCLIEGSRHCGNLGQCGCYCWGSYEG